MKKHLKYIISVVLIFIVATSQVVFAANDKPSKNFISQVIAFGDSHSDNGEAKRITTAIVNSPDAPEGAYIKPSDELYWENRYSNGPTSVEILAENLGVHLFNYATGGATSGEGNYSAWMDHLGPTGLLGQIQAFEKSLNGQKADPNALYFIFASANDYYLFMDYELEGEITEVADQAVANMNTAVEKLASLGAKKFFVVNSSDLSIVPYEVTTERTAEAKAFTERVNKELPKTLKKLEKDLDVSILLFDHTKVSDKIVKNPKKYRITVISQECQSTYPEVKPARENPDQYLFWDEWHFSRAAHKIFGGEMYEAVKTFNFKK